jgi:hypothetical protein
MPHTCASARQVSRVPLPVLMLGFSDAVSLGKGMPIRQGRAFSGPNMNLQKLWKP